MRREKTSVNIRTITRFTKRFHKVARSAAALCEQRNSMKQTLFRGMLIYFFSFSRLITLIRACIMKRGGTNLARFGEGTNLQMFAEIASALVLFLFATGRCTRAPSNCLNCRANRSPELFTH